MFVVCRITANSEPKSRRCTAAERDQTPSGENGADCCEWVDLWTPECVCLRVGPPVWPTACLYSRLSVCVLFALRRSALQCRPWTCKKERRIPSYVFYTLRNVASHQRVHKASVRPANKRSRCVLLLIKNKSTQTVFWFFNSYSNFTLSSSSLFLNTMAAVARDALKDKFNILGQKQLLVRWWRYVPFTCPQS